jgi:hypothetical protein
MRNIDLFPPSSPAPDASPLPAPPNDIRAANAPLSSRFLLSLAAGLSALAGTQTVARAAEGAEFITAVSSIASKDYKRAKLPDGGFQTEYYSFGDGGKMGGPMSDPTIDQLKFMDVAAVIARPLAKEKFLPARDPKTTRLVIMVYWGTTQIADPIQDSAAFLQYQHVRDEIAAEPPPTPSTPGQQAAPSKDLWAMQAAMNNAPSGTDAEMSELSDSIAMIQMENHDRNRIDRKNAQLLGYDSEDSLGLVGTDRGEWVGHTSLGRDQHDQILEIESPRYFVILMAYDFQLMWKEKKHKLLWETRFSINQPHNEFTKALPAMAQYASQYFGQNSHGLIRETLREGNVTVGEPTLVELLGSPKK